VFFGGGFFWGVFFWVFFWGGGGVPTRNGSSLSFSLSLLVFRESPHEDECMLFDKRRASTGEPVLHEQRGRWSLSPRWLLPSMGFSARDRHRPCLPPNGRAV